MCKPGSVSEGLGKAAKEGRKFENVEMVTFNGCEDVKGEE